MRRTVPAVLLILLFSPFCTPALSFTCPTITTSDASQRMTTLADEIRYHNRLYYEKAQPAISDAEYDRLFAGLIQLEGCFPALVAADSPTRTVGSSGDGGTQLLKHEQPMLSLSSSSGPEAVEALLKRIAADGDLQLLVQPKVDGLPVELVYDQGRLVSASTRGNGRFGEDVTGRVREIQGIPLLLTGTFPDRVVVRGEVYADLRLLKNLGQGATAEKYATPRHAAAGVLKAHRPDPAAVALLRLFPFELVAAGPPGSGRESLTLLAEWGFPVDLKQSVAVRTFAGVQAVYRDCLANRARQPFAMDGIVVKVDDLQLRQRLGEGERAPFWAAAWKFPPETALTRVREILWTVGRTGRRTPVAVLVPVQLGGVQVARVSLHNAAELERLDVAAGDQVVVALAGDVIPRLLEVVERVDREPDAASAAIRGPQAPPDACLHDSPVCRGQFLARAAYFVSKSGLDIAGLGRGRLVKLVEAGLLEDLPALFLLTAEEVAAVPGFATKTAQRLADAIRAAGHPDPFRLVAALGIPGVGPKSAQRLAGRFTSLDELLAAGQGEVMSLPAADRRAAAAIRGFFRSAGGQELLVKFRNVGVL